MLCCFSVKFFCSLKCFGLSLFGDSESECFQYVHNKSRRRLPLKARTPQPGGDADAVLRWDMEAIAPQTWALPPIFAYSSSKTSKQLYRGAFFSRVGVLEWLIW